MDYCEFMEQWEMQEIANANAMREAEKLVRECRAAQDALDAFEENATANGYRNR